VVPERAITRVAAVTLPEELARRPAFSRSAAAYVGKIFDELGFPFDLRVCLKGANHGDLASTVGTFEDLDFTVQVPVRYRRPLRLQITRAARIHGFLAWLHLLTGGGGELDILEHEHCWIPVFLPVFGEGVEVTSGDVIEAEVSASPALGRRHPDYRLTGQLTRAGRPAVDFDYTSWHSAAAHRASPFYARLFPDGPRVEEHLSFPGTDTLRRRLRERLPHWMVPGPFVVLDALPLTPNGKVDRSALPDVQPARTQVEHQRVPARTPIERVAAAACADVLGVDDIGVEEDFFELGGDSLTAAQVASRLNETFGATLSLQSLFDAPSVAALAVLVLRQLINRPGAGSPIPGPDDEVSVRLRDLSLEKRVVLERRVLSRLGSPPDAEAVTRRRPGDPSPLSFAQQRLWFLEQWRPGSHTYNASLPMRIRGRPDLEALTGALDAVVARHEVLRTTYESTDGTPVQVPGPPRAVELLRIDLSTLGPSERWPAAMARLQELASRPFDLTADLMTRAAVLKLDETEHVLLVTAHHIACDGWSKTILFRELASFYESARRGESPDLPELAIQYADYASWQARWLSGGRLDALTAWWSEHLAGAPVALNMPTERRRPLVQTFAGALHWLDLPASLTDELRELGRREGATLYMTLLAVFGALVRARSGDEVILVGSPIANRPRVELEDLIGFFANTLILRSDVSGDPTFRTLLARHRASALASFAHQDLPFEKIVEAIRPPRDPGRNPLVQINFRVQDKPPATLELAGLVLEPLELDTGISRFDFALDLHAHDGGLRGALEYNTELFGDVWAQDFSADFLYLLTDLAAHPDEPLSRLASFSAMALPTVAASAPAPRAALRAPAR
jgi:acyl carrier protein